LEPEPKSKADKTYKRILDSAAQVFRERGYSDTRLVDIAARAELQTGSLYYHFRSREELVEAVLSEGFGYARDLVTSQLDDLPDTASSVDVLEVAIRSHLHAVFDKRAYTSAAIRIISHVPTEIHDRHVAARSSYVELWRRLIENAVDAGAIRADINQSIIRETIIGALNWSAEWYEPDGSLSADDVSDQLSRLLLDSLLYGVHGNIGPAATQVQGVGKGRKPTIKVPTADVIGDNGRQGAPRSGRQPA
jgi:AcrR family transcriptional regulator